MTAGMSQFTSHRRCFLARFRQMFLGVSHVARMLWADDGTRLFRFSALKSFVNKDDYRMMSDALSSLKPGKERSVAVLFWVCVLLMLIMPSGLFVSEFLDAQRQHHINRSYISIDATVISAQVTSFKESKGGVHYVPEVQYRYEVDGNRYHSDRVTALPCSGNEDWAKSVVDRHKTDQTCRAFRDPEDASESILIRAYSFRPYFNMLEMAFVLTGGCMFVMRTRYEKKREPIPLENGRFAIQSAFGMRQHLLIAKGCTAVWYGAGAIPMAHYFLCVPAPHNVRAVYAFIGFAMLGLIPIGLLIRYSLINRNFDDARLLLNQPLAFLGQAFRFSITQSARRQLQLNQVRVRFRCVAIKAEGKSRKRRTLYESTPVDLKSHVLHMGESLEFSGELIPPIFQRPTGRDATREFDWINWEIRLDCDVAHAPDYEASFPVNVHGARVKEPEIPEGEPRTFVEVRAVEPRFAGTILTKRHVLLANLIALVQLAPLLAGIGMMAAVYTVVFQDHSKPLLDLPLPQAQLLFASGAVLSVLGTCYGLMFPSLLSNLYLHRLTKRAIGLRPDAVVKPGVDSIRVEIIPRSNWNRLMLETASDIGFLAVDTPRREILFEGDKERYRIPVEAIQSCELEKSYYSATARANAPCIWFVVLRGYAKNGIWEAPIVPRCLNGRVSSKRRQRASQELQAKIKAMMPATALSGEAS
jgi:hypothetical protein